MCKRTHTHQSFHSREANSSEGDRLHQASLERRSPGHCCGHSSVLSVGLDTHCSCEASPRPLFSEGLYSGVSIEPEREGVDSGCWQDQLGQHCAGVVFPAAALGFEGDIWRTAVSVGISWLCTAEPSLCLHVLV